MSLKKLLCYLYTTLTKREGATEQANEYPWLMIRDIQLDNDFRNIDDEELIPCIDVAMEKGYIQVDWKLPFSNSLILLLQSGQNFVINAAPKHL